MAGKSMVREGRGRMPKKAHEEGLRVARVLAAWLEERGLSIREIEERVGWGQKTLYEVLTGKQPLRISHIAAVAAAAGFSLSDFYRALSEGYGEASSSIAAAEASPTRADLVLGFPREEVERVFAEQLKRFGLEPESKLKEQARPQDKFRKTSKA